MFTVKWLKCGDDGHWCPLEQLNLDSVTEHGVYIIWHQGDPSRIVRVGQGVVADRLAKHRKDPLILFYKNKGTLRVTWAYVPAHQRDGVEHYLAEMWNPLVGDAFPDAVPIAVNSPFAA